MPHKDPAARRLYQRRWETTRRRARGVPVQFDSIEAHKPWEKYGISRILWWRRYRWAPTERERWRHRERPWAQLEGPLLSAKTVPPTSR